MLDRSTLAQLFFLYMTLSLGGNDAITQLNELEPRQYDTVIVPTHNDLANGTRRGVWSLGGTSFGRSKPDLLVGHPNTCDRGDRALVRFPITAFIAVGKVKRAILYFELSPRFQIPFGKSAMRQIEMEHFIEDQPCLNLLDWHRDAVEHVISFVVSRKNPASAKWAFDITSIVNADLRQGFSSVTLRFKDPAAEQDGNPDGIPNGIAICTETISLEIVKEDKEL